MTSSFLIAISVWFGINILFVAVRLWVTRPKNRRLCHGGVSRLGVVRVIARLHRHV